MASPSPTFNVKNLTSQDHETIIAFLFERIGVSELQLAIMESPTLDEFLYQVPIAPADSTRESLLFYILEADPHSPTDVREVTHNVRTLAAMLGLCDDISNKPILRFNHNAHMDRIEVPEYYLAK